MHAPSKLSIRPMSLQSSPFPSCFRPSSAAADHHNLPPLPPPASGNPNLSTSLYQTHLGLFSLTWSRTLFGHCLNLHLHPNDDNNCSPLSLPYLLSLSTLSCQLHINSFPFWKKHGSKKLHIVGQDTASPAPRIQLYWDFSRAKFGSRPEPQSGYYIAVVVGSETVLLVGDLTKEAYRKTKSPKPERSQVLVMRREHVFGNRAYKTKVRFGGKNREISIECSVNNDARLSFSVDSKRVLQIKRLKWKFRGNEKVEVDGVPVQISWDVYNWFFDDLSNSHAVFMFRFETLDIIEGEEHEVVGVENRECDGEAFGGYHQHAEEKNGAASWQQSQSSGSFGMRGVEWKRMRKSLMRTARSSSSSSISMSSVSSGCSSSVMEWASTEESELFGPKGFSLLVYAWNKK
ncbi:hypothetical protein K2173_025823 [Erythroxylum novogranatense]|uniref:DUF868 family protein n=1 Tax=Erythroxylum novogranatense TaxID=1862640 RepID=A0AAV8SI30_9ROSI|nr:hypothetical protein K2173_025823 [Erythroxylum novogranatense]